MGETVQFGRTVDRPEETRAERIQRTGEEQRQAAQENRMASLEGRIAALEVYSWDNGIREAVAEAIGETADQVDEAGEKRLLNSVTALRDELQIEVAVVRDELLAKIESRIFGVSLADFDPDQFRRVIAELRSDIDKQTAALNARLDSLSERIDSTDKRRRYDRNTSRGERDELASKLTALFGGMIARTDKRLDDLVADIRNLRAELGDEGPFSPVLALPAN
jgi:hypothetical protein